MPGRAVSTLFLVLAALACAAPSAAGAAARQHPELTGELAAKPSGAIRLFVRGTSVARVREAAAARGFTALGAWTSIDTVLVRGDRRGVRGLRRARGIRFLELDRPLVPMLDTATQATRAASLATFTDAAGRPVDGRGVSAAVVDTGVDGSHPFFSTGSGSAVVRNLKVVCFGITLPGEGCYVDGGPRNDTDTMSTGGHGTHVAGIVAGRPTQTLSGRGLRGSGPGAAVVSISGGQVISMALNLSAQEWVLRHHAAPCGAGADRAACPPIRVVNHSWGPGGGGTFNPESATVRIQRELLKAGVATVWAAGNDGGDGSQVRTNPPGQDPLGGILMVANYDDADSGARDGKLSNSSSRGKVGERSTYPDVSAPGTRITSSCRAWLVICSAHENGPASSDLLTFGTISGTSMAAPHVTGIVAALFQAEPSATPAQVEQAIIETAHPFTAGLPYEDDPRGGRTSADKGHGLVDAPAALVRLREFLGTTPAAPASPASVTGEGSGGSSSTGSGAPSRGGSSPSGGSPGSSGDAAPATCAKVKKARRAVTRAKRALKRARGRSARVRAKRLVKKRKVALVRARRACR
ncbi:MAG TPA: S8 family serine peptidase [Solirubrobacteraceae bacterium]|nr:S8 family serine peptidase [Solirubrobacteraceae bacterium]